MFTTYVGRPVLSKCVQYGPHLDDVLIELKPDVFSVHPTLGFSCLCGRTYVGLTEGDWIVTTRSKLGFEVFTDSQFKDQFQQAEDIEIIPTASKMLGPI